MRLARRYGRFSISRSLLDMPDLSAQAIMASCLVWRAEYLMYPDEIEYLAYSDHFRELSEGEVVPTYTWTCNETGIVTATERAA
jgi:hypothetical protein